MEQLNDKLTYDQRLKKIRELGVQVCGSYIEIFDGMNHVLQLESEKNEKIMKHVIHHEVKSMLKDHGIIKPNTKLTKAAVAVLGQCEEVQRIKTFVDFEKPQQQMDENFLMISRLKKQSKKILKSDFLVIKEICQNFDKTFLKKYADMSQWTVIDEDVSDLEAIFNVGTWEAMKFLDEENLINEKEMEELFMEKQKLMALEQKEVERKQKEAADKMVAMKEEYSARECYANGEFKKQKTEKEESMLESLKETLLDIRDIKRDLVGMYSISASKQKEDFISTYEALSQYLDMKAFENKGKFLFSDNLNLKQLSKHLKRLYDKIDLVKINCVVEPTIYTCAEAE